MAGKQAFDVTTDVGRIVWGDVFRGRTHDKDNKPYTNAQGQPAMEWSFGVAIPKQACGNIMDAMSKAAQAGFPAGVNAATFRWKFRDGDEPALSTREGYRGCFVFAFKGRVPPRVLQLSQGAYVQLSQGVKCGDYVRIKASIKGNDGQSPGLYVNPDLVEFVGAGVEIHNGPDPMAAFGGVAVALPPGAAAPGHAPLPGAAPGGYVAPAPQYAAPAPAPVQPVQPVQYVAPAAGYPLQQPPPPVYPVQHAPPAAAPGVMPAGVQPHPGFVTAAGVQPAPGYPAAPQSGPPGYPPH